MSLTCAPSFDKSLNYNYLYRFQIGQIIYGQLLVSTRLRPSTCSDNICRNCPVWTCWPKLAIFRQFFSDFQEIVQRTYTLPGNHECQMADRLTFRSVWMVKYLWHHTKRIICFLQGILAMPTVGRKISSQSGNCADMLCSVTCQKMALLWLLKVSNT